MKLKCLSTGDGYHFPPSHIVSICGFGILCDFPIDLSSLVIFSPISTCYQKDSDAGSSLVDTNSPVSPRAVSKKRRIGTPLKASDLISTEPLYKIATDLRHLDFSSIDVVLITSPMGMLGLPYLTRSRDVHVKIYATEATKRLGQLMMEELVAMHAEFRQFYGPMETPVPYWMKQEGLEALNPVLREIVIGKDGTNLGNWQALYSSEDVKACLQNVQTLKYAEEVCYNGTLVIKAFSSGLEIGGSNWTVESPRWNAAFLSASLFESACAASFDYFSLQGRDLILFSDFSCLHGPNDIGASLAKGDDFDSKEESLIDEGEGMEEMKKLAFISSCIINSVGRGGSVLISIGRLGIVLQLLEQISLSLEDANLKVPIFMISMVAEEMLSFVNIAPEWLSKGRQEKLYAGEPLFSHVELIRGLKLHVFPQIWSSNLITTWQEPCIVFSSHWTLRLGPAIYLLNHWHEDPRSLLVMEEGFDTELALLPFKPLAMKVLKCAFLFGVRAQKIPLLLKKLQPKLILFPEDLKTAASTQSITSFLLLYYTRNEMLRVPSIRDHSEAVLAMDLARHLKPRVIEHENVAIARFRGEVQMSQGKHHLVAPKFSAHLTRKQSVYWGSLDLSLLLAALSEKGLEASFIKDSDDGDNDARGRVNIEKPEKAVLIIDKTCTVICTANKEFCTQIIDAVESVLSGI